MNNPSKGGTSKTTTSFIFLLLAAFLALGLARLLIPLIVWVWEYWITSCTYYGVPFISG